MYELLISIAAPFFISCIGLSGCYFFYNNYLIKIPNDFSDGSAYQSQSISMKTLKKTISRSSRTFLFLEYFSLIVAVLILFIAIGVVINWTSAFSFALGAIASAIAGYLAMKVSTASYQRCAVSATKIEDGLAAAFHVVITSSCCIGIIVQSTALLLICFLMIVLKLVQGDLNSFTSLNAESVLSLTAYGLGASTVSVFSRLGGGIFSRAAEIGASCLTSRGFKTYDRRNAATVALLIGNNVGSIVGVSSDLQSSFSGAILTSIVLGSRTVDANVSEIITFVLNTATVGLITSIVGMVIIIGGKFMSSVSVDSLNGLMRVSVFVSSILQIGITAALTYTVGGIKWAPFGSYSIGVFAGFLISLWALHLQRYNRKVACDNINNAATFGFIILFIEGLGFGLYGTLGPAFSAGAVVITSKFLSDSPFGVSLAALGALSNVALHIGLDQYRFLVSSAHSLMRLSVTGSSSTSPGSYAEARKYLRTLKKLGNSTSRMGQSFVVVAASLAAISLFYTYVDKIELSTYGTVVTSERFIGGVLIGSAVPFVYGALPLQSIVSASQSVALEVVRQLECVGGLLENRVNPDYSQCVRITQIASLHAMVVPAILPLVTPFIFGIGLGAEFLVGSLLGIIGAGFVLSSFLQAAGSCWSSFKDDVALLEHDLRVIDIDREPIGGRGPVRGSVSDSSLSYSGVNDGTVHCQSRARDQTNVGNIPRNLHHHQVHPDLSNLTSEMSQTRAVSPPHIDGNGSNSNHSGDDEETKFDTQTTSTTIDLDMNAGPIRKSLQNSIRLGSIIADPFNDAVGPGIGIQVKDMCYVSSVFASVLASEDIPSNWWVAVVLLFATIGFCFLWQRWIPTPELSAVTLDICSTAATGQDLPSPLLRSPSSQQVDSQSMDNLETLVQTSMVTKGVDIEMTDDSDSISDVPEEKRGDFDDDKNDI